MKKRLFTLALSLFLVGSIGCSGDGDKGKKSDDPPTPGGKPSQEGLPKPPPLPPPPKPPK
jgi:hypothetical protein